MTGRWILAVAVVAGCGKKPDQRARCERIMFGVESEIAKCMTWTDTQVRCVERMDDSPECEAAFAAILGLEVSEVKGEGPPPAWEVALSLPASDSGWVAPPTALYPTGGGVIVEHGFHLIGVTEDGERWRTEIPGLTEVAVGPCVAAISGDSVRCLDAATGAVRWQRATGDNEAGWHAGAWRGEELLLIDGAGEIAVADPRACVADPAGAACLRRAPTPLAVVPSPLDGELLVASGGGWFAVDQDHVIAVGPDDVPIAYLRVDAGDDWVTLPAVTRGGAALVGWGRAIHRIDPAACRGSADVIDAAAAPPGCVTKVAESGDEPVDGWAPLPLGEDGVAFTSGNVLHVWRGGERQWAVELSYALQLRGGDPLIFTGGAQLGGLDLPPEVRAVSAVGGETRWMTRLPSLGSTGTVGPVFAADDRWLYIASATKIAVLPRRAHR